MLPITKICETNATKLDFQGGSSFLPRNQWNPCFGTADEARPIHWLPTLRPPYPLPRLCCCCCCWTRRWGLNWCPGAGFACCCGTVLMRWAFICAKSASIVLGAAWFCISLAFPFWKASPTGLLCTKVLVLGLFHLPALLRIGIAAAFFAACFVTGNWFPTRFDLLCARTP